MASTMAAAAAHSMPPFPLPAIPRVRPPPIPKGTPGPNTLPPPGAPPRSDLVWADGKWRVPDSKSAIRRSRVASRQLEKALHHETHGMNIYAYKHIRTHQVIYSLTKNMENNAALKQLLFHGKKTVPAALRRDMWRPYFSIHFPQTPAGAYKGLRVFQELRELSLKRQLDPPKEMITADEEKVNMSRLDLNKERNRRKYVLGEKLNRRTIAERLMNQQATSVADVAAVLTRWTLPMKSSEKSALTPRERLLKRRRERADKEKAQSRRSLQQLASVRKQEKGKQLEIAERITYLQDRPGNVLIDEKSLERINIEFEGDRDMHLHAVEQAKKETDEERGVRRTYLEAWTQHLKTRTSVLEDLEASMTAEIAARIDAMPEAERADVLASIEAEKTDIAHEADIQISQKQEEFRKEREERRAQYGDSRKPHEQSALNRMTNKHNEIIRKMRLNAKWAEKYAGPYAEIRRAVAEKKQQLNDEFAKAQHALRPADTTEAQEVGDGNGHKVEIRWANPRDGTYARSWPDTVSHHELQPKAIAELANRTPSTVHVFGSEIPLQIELDGKSPDRHRSAFLDEETAAQRLELEIERQAKLERHRYATQIVKLSAEAMSFETLPSQGEISSDAETLRDCIEQANLAHAELKNLMNSEPQEANLEYVKSLVEWLRETIPYAVKEVDQAKQPYVATGGRLAQVKQLIDAEQLNGPDSPAAVDHLERPAETGSNTDVQEVESPVKTQPKVRSVNQLRIEWVKKQVAVLERMRNHIASMRDAEQFAAIINDRFALMANHADARDNRSRLAAIEAIDDFDAQHQYLDLTNVIEQAITLKENLAAAKDRETSRAAREALKTFHDQYPSLAHKILERSIVSLRHVEGNTELQKMRQIIDRYDEQLSDPLLSNKDEVETRIAQLNEAYTEVVERQINELKSRNPAVYVAMFEAFKVETGVGSERPESSFGQSTDSEAFTVKKEDTTGSEKPLWSEAKTKELSVWGRVKRLMGL